MNLGNVLVALLVFSALFGTPVCWLLLSRTLRQVEEDQELKLGSQGPVKPEEMVPPIGPAIGAFLESLPQRQTNIAREELLIKGAMSKILQAIDPQILTPKPYSYYMALGDEELEFQVDVRIKGRRAFAPRKYSIRFIEYAGSEERSAKMVTLPDELPGFVAIGRTIQGNGEGSL